MNAFQRLRRDDDRLCHRHRFEHLVLDATCHPEGRYRYPGMGKVGPHVRYRAGDDDAGKLSQCQHSRRRPRADDDKHHVRASSAQAWQDFRRKPFDGIDIGPVIHGAGEHDGALTRRIRIVVGTVG